MIDKLTSIFCRLFFLFSLLILFASLIDRFLRFFGWTLTIAYQPGRMLELSAMLMIFVIALLLRQIRESMDKK